MGKLEGNLVAVHQFIAESGNNFTFLEVNLCLDWLTVYEDTDRWNQVRCKVTDQANGLGILNLHPTVFDNWVKLNSHAGIIVVKVSVLRVGFEKFIVKWNNKVTNWHV